MPQSEVVMTHRSDVKVVEASVPHRPNKRMHPTPLRVERDRRNFENQRQLKRIPDLQVRRG